MRSTAAPDSQAVEVRWIISHDDRVVVDAMDSLKYLKTVVAFANGCDWRTVFDTSRQFE